MTPRRAGEDPRLRSGAGAPTPVAEGASVGDGHLVPTEPGAVLGTLRLHVAGAGARAAADHRADIFAFGTVLYEMLTGPPRVLRRDPGRHPGRHPAPRSRPSFGHDRDRGTARPGADPEALPREEPGGALPVGARPGLRARGAVGFRAVAPRHRSYGAGSPARATGNAGLVAGLGSASSLSAWPTATRPAQAARPGARLTFHQLTFRQGGLHERGSAPTEDRLLQRALGRQGGRRLLHPARQPRGSCPGPRAMRGCSRSPPPESSRPALRASSWEKGTLARLTFPGERRESSSPASTHADWSPDGRTWPSSAGSEPARVPGGQGPLPVGSDHRCSSLLPAGRPDGVLRGRPSSVPGTSGTIWMVDLAGKKTRLFTGAIDLDDGLAWSPSW